MTPSARKTFWWYTLAASLGGTAFFLFLCIIESPPPIYMIGVYLWPASCIATTVFAIRILRRCYRDEPDAFRGFFQLSIVELYAVVLFAALWMGGWRAFSPGTFVPAGMTISVLMSASYALCLLIAARNGFTASRVKIPYAAGLQFKTLGWLGLGALIMICLFFILYRGEVKESFSVIEFCVFGTGEARHTGELLPVHVAMLFLLPGTVICWIVKKRRRVLS